MHRIPLQEFYKRLGTDPEKGLTSDQAQLRLQKDGPNSSAPAALSFWRTAGRFPSIISRRPLASIRAASATSRCDKMGIPW
ncbi:MAG: cation-transporting P-type ATPase [Thermoguttaceae bacterium]